jgi:hypothetical protein
MRATFTNCHGHAKNELAARQVLTVAVAWEAVRRATEDVRSAHAAGAMGAILPLAVVLARTEEAFVLAALLQVSALLGLARGDRQGGLLTAAAVGLLANVRPDQGLAAVALAIVLSVRHPWLAVVATVPVALRWSAILRSSVREELDVDDLVRPLLHLVGPESPTVWLDPFRTPFWLLPSLRLSLATVRLPSSQQFRLHKQAAAAPQRAKVNRLTAGRSLS